MENHTKESMRIKIRTIDKAEALSIYNSFMKICLDKDKTIQCSLFFIDSLIKEYDELFNKYHFEYFKERKIYFSYVKRAIKLINEL